MLKRLFVIFFILLIGCKSEPPDSDQDGIIDSEDECPELAGTSAYQGCPAYTLTVSLNPIEGGSVSPSGGQHKHGTTLSLTASPSSEFNFSSWSGDLTGTSLNASLTMLSDKTIEANFVKKKYNFSSSVEGEGTITTKVIQPGATDKYNSGTILELTANPASEWVFSEWRGDLTGNDNPKQITVDGPKVITAVFVKKKYKVDIEVQGEGSVTTEVIQTGAANDYNSGTILKLTANPAAGWNFDRWEGDLTGNQNPINVTIDANKDVKAVFKNNIIGEWEYYFYEFDINGDGLSWDVRDMLAVYGYKNIYVFKVDNSFDWIDGRGGSSSSNNTSGGWWEINGTNLSWKHGPNGDQEIRYRYDLTFLCDNNIVRFRREIVYNDGTKRNTFEYLNRKGYDPSICDIKYKSD